MNNKKEMTRAQVLDELSLASTEGRGLIDLKEIIRNGCTGLIQLSNKELAADYKEVMGLTLEDEGYSGIYITGKDLSYYESMERCLHKTITDYFTLAKEYEAQSKCTSFHDMSEEHRVIDILIFIKSKKNLH